MKTLCIIPARGGSKGIPGKNLKILAGKPLLAWSIEAALDSRLVNRTIVSTDDPKIAQTTLEWGAEVVDRPKEIADDFASSESALIHVLKYLKDNENYTPDLIVFLQATSPIRCIKDIDNSVKLLLDNNFDSVFSAYREHFTGRWRVDERGYAKPANFNPLQRPRRQDVPCDFIENGSIYVFKPEHLLQNGSRMNGKIGIYEMPYENSFQIDSPEDLLLLEKILAHPRNQHKHQSATVPSNGLLKRIKLLALDFDGVLTDNRVWIDQNGIESVCCSRADSWGLTQLKKTGIRIAVVSTESNPVVKARCEKLKIHCESNVMNKVEALKQISAKWGIKRSEIAFAGNDLNDKDALEWAGFSIVVGKSDSDLINLADWYISETGGNGAVRKICDGLIDAQCLNKISGNQKD